jgi:hypothetical protein
MSDDLAELRVRVIQARTRFDAIPEIGVGELGPRDPETGERWNRLHVLGHLAEALPFWTGEIRKGLAGRAGSVAAAGRPRRETATSNASYRSATYRGRIGQ